MIVIVMLEPSLVGEKLTATEQIHEIIGPFDTEDDADLWLRSYQMRSLVANEWRVPMAPSKFAYYITNVVTPSAMDEVLGKWMRR